MAAWPSTLPAPTLSGYGLEIPDQTIRTDMESGAARVRRRSTAAPDTVSLRVMLTDAEMAIFRAFWEGDAQHGAAWFSMALKLGRAPGMTTREVRPKPASYKATLISNGWWTLTFAVEVRNA